MPTVCGVVNGSVSSYERGYTKVRSLKPDSSDESEGGALARDSTADLRRVFCALFGAIFEWETSTT
jgi:hypothetical protein